MVGREVEVTVVVYFLARIDAEATFVVLLVGGIWPEGIDIEGMFFDV